MSEFKKKVDEEEEDEEEEDADEEQNVLKKFYEGKFDGNEGEDEDEFEGLPEEEDELDDEDDEDDEDEDGGTFSCRVVPDHSIPTQNLTFFALLSSLYLALHPQTMMMKMVEMEKKMTRKVMTMMQLVRFIQSSFSLYSICTLCWICIPIFCSLFMLDNAMTISKVFAFARMTCFLQHLSYPFFLFLVVNHYYTSSCGGQKKSR